MPRASHGVRHTVSVLRGAHDHVVFDVTSKVVDFLVLCNSNKCEGSPGEAKQWLHWYYYLNTHALHLLWIRQKRVIFVVLQLKLDVMY